MVVVVPAFGTELVQLFGEGRNAPLKVVVLDFTGCAAGAPIGLLFSKNDGSKFPYNLTAPAYNNKVRYIS